MKHNIQQLSLVLLSCVALAFVTQSCNKDSAADFYLAIDYASMSLDAGEGHSYIQIYANGPWTAGFEEGEQTWCRLDKTSGSGRDAIRFDYDANAESSPRKVTFFVQREETVKNFVITQAGL